MEDKIKRVRSRQKTRERTRLFALGNLGGTNMTRWIVEVNQVKRQGSVNSGKVKHESKIISRTGKFGINKKEAY